MYADLREDSVPMYVGLIPGCQHILNQAVQEVAQILQRNIGKLQDTLMYPEFSSLPFSSAITVLAV